MSLFEIEPICPDCKGQNRVWDQKLGATVPCRNKQHHRDPAALADFDGATYDHDRDHVRLGKQAQAVWAILRDGRWHTLSEISRMTHAPEASVSARIRDLRKPKFGGHNVVRENIGEGRWRYRLIPHDQP